MSSLKARIWWGFLRVSGGVSHDWLPAGVNGAFSPRERRCFSCVE